MEKDTGSEKVGKKVPNPTGIGGFKKGWGGGPGRGKKKPKPSPGSELIADFDRAYSTPESESDSPIVKALRRMAHDEPLKFIAQYAKVKSGTPETPEADGSEFGSVGPKEVAVEELAEQLLAEWEREDAADRR